MLLPVLALLVCGAGGQPPAGGGPPGGGPPPGGRGEDFEIRIGLTLGLSGRHNVVSKHARQGIQLVEQVFNNDLRLFGIAPGQRYRLIFDIHNDESQEDKVRELYAQLANDSRYMAYMGPYSSGLSLIAAEVMNRSGKVLMNHQASTPSIYQQGFRNLFSVNLMATDYFAGALALLYEKGARTISLAQGPSIFHEALCTGARSHALTLGFQVLSSVSIADADISAGIQESASYSADVFVGCGHLHNAVQVVVASRALMFNPKAMLIAQATGKDFSSKVLARNALYTLGPLIWDHHVPQECILFGSAQAFHEMYTATYGESPTYHAAQAAAGAIALVVAVRLNWEDPDDNPVPTHEQIANTLRTMQIESLFGKLNFSAVDGTRPGISGFAQQFGPLRGNNISRMDTYNDVAPIFLSTASEMVYPAPSWEQKELEIYPCPVGTELSFDQSTCKVCPVGRFRDQASIECRICTEGTYGFEAGLEHCHRCEQGMDCANMRAEGTYIAAPGYYYLESSRSFQECEPWSLCLGRNKCSASQQGVLCSKCISGYTNTGPWGIGTSECSECPNQVLDLLGLVVLVLYAQALYRIVLVSHQKSYSSLTSIHTIILRIVLNYTTFLGCFIEANDYLKKRLGFRILIGLFLDPVSNFLSLHCITGASSQPYLILVALGLFLIPILLLFSFLFTLMRDMFPVVWHYFFPRQEPPSFSSEEEDPPAEELDDDEEAQGRVSVNRTPPPTTPPRKGSVSGRSRRGSDPILDPTAFACTPDIMGVNKAPTNVDGDDKAGMVGLHAVASEVANYLRLDDSIAQIFDNARKRYIRRAVIWLFILYPIVVRMLLMGVICVQKDELRLAADLEIICQGEKHIQWFRLCVFGLLMYGLGIPSVLFFQLFRIRGRLLEVKVRRNFGFLYNGFEHSYWYMEPVYMMRKMLVLCALPFPTKSLRFLVLTGMGLLFVGLHIRCEPFDDRDFFVLDRLETLNLLAFLFSCLVGLWFAVNQEMAEGDVPAFSRLMQSETFDIVFIVLVTMMHVAFAVLAVWALLRNLVIKQLRFLEECFPEHLSSLQRCMLWCVSKQWHHLKMNPETHEIDVRDLSYDERRFLSAALADTMFAYIQAAVRDTKREKPGVAVDPHRFYLGHLIAALRRAYKRVEFVRYRRVVHYLEAIQVVHPEKKAWLWRMLPGLERFKDLLCSYADAASREMGAENLRDTMRQSFRRSTRFSSYFQRQAFKNGPAGTTEATSPDSSAEKRASQSVKNLGVTVEELHMALMLSWGDIAAGKEDYYILETEEDREHQFYREVMAARGTTWDQADSVKKLFKSLELRKLNAAGNRRDTFFGDDDHSSVASDEESKSQDIENLLGLQPASEERALSTTLRQEHEEQLREVLDLQAVVRGLERELACYEKPQAADPELQVGDEDFNENTPELGTHAPHAASSSSVPRGASRSSPVTKEPSVSSSSSESSVPQEVFEGGETGESAFQSLFKQADAPPSAQGDLDSIAVEDCEEQKEEPVEAVLEEAEAAPPTVESPVAEESASAPFLDKEGEHSDDSDATALRLGHVLRL